MWYHWVLGTCVAYFSREEADWEYKGKFYCRENVKIKSLYKRNSLAHNLQTRPKLQNLHFFTQSQWLQIPTEHLPGNHSVHKEICQDRKF